MFMFDMSEFCVLNSTEVQPSKSNVMKCIYHGLLKGRDSGDKKSEADSNGLPFVEK
jgi:hypothetical protein